MFAIVAVAVVFFAWNRWQAELVAVVALLAAALIGVVPMAQALNGLGDPALVVIAVAAVISAAIRDSGVFAGPVRLIDKLPPRAGPRIGLAGVVVATVSAVMSNADAATSFLPAAQSTARQTGRSLPIMIQTLVLASLFGGTITLVGSTANILVSAIRRRMQGSEFGVFDFAPVGLVLAIVAVILIVLCWRFLVPRAERTDESGTSLRDASFTGELLVPEDSPLVGQTIGALQSRGESRIQVSAVIREEFRRLTPRPDWAVEPNDVLVLACVPETLQLLMETLGLRIAGGAGTSAADPDQTGIVEALVTPASELVGESGGSSRLDDRFRLGLLAIGRHGDRPPVRLRRAKFRAGDVLVLQGELDTMASTLSGIGCLSLAERRLRLGQRRLYFVPSIILAAALGLSFFTVLPIALALLCGMTFLVLLRITTLAELYGMVPWPTIILVAALLPFSAALGSTETIDTLSHLVPADLAHLPESVAVGAVLVVSLLVTALVRAIPAALLLAPLALGFAAKNNLAADPLLMAVAVGTSCDALAPMAHQSRRAVARFGVPLLIAVALIAPPTILFFWPLHP